MAEQMHAIRKPDKSLLGFDLVAEELRLTVENPGPELLSKSRVDLRPGLPLA